ncbi:MAG: alkaline phosphatase [Hyphomicrobiaceae bacterium]
MFVRFFAAVAICMIGASAGQAQTIYPLDRAEILAGSEFDLKVEFPGNPDPKSLKVFLNGVDAATALGKEPWIIPLEEGLPQVSYWVRRVKITTPGKVTVEALNGNDKAIVTWEVFDTPKGRTAKNVILFVGDGLSMAHRTAARILSKQLVEGRYGGELAIDDMPHMALVSTHGSDAIVTDSANSMSAYTTGHKSCVNALGVYCANNRSTQAHPWVENITTLAKRKLGLAVGVVTNTEIQDATPAAMVAHTRRRMDYDDIVKAFYDVQPEVILGGGSVHFLPASHPDGKRRDNVDYVEKFTAAGYAFTKTKSEMLAAARDAKTTKLLGLFNKSNIDGALDRKFLKKGTVPLYPDQPDLTDQVKAALAVLAKNDNGFLLMVESGRIDKYSHSLDWERSVYDTIMLDNAVAVAKQFAGDRNDTLIITVADHAHPISVIGTYDDAAGPGIRERLQLYDKSKFPNYEKPDAEGYPPSVDVSRRLAVVFAGIPDHCDAGKPHLSGENVPAQPASDGKSSVPNEANCAVPGAARRVGNLPMTAGVGIHSADDVVLTAMGPGSEMFRGRIDNTRVFRAMAIALGLGK